MPQELKLQTVEQQLYTKQCPKCQTFNTASFPLEVANWVQYGPKIRALAVYLNQYNFCPMPEVAKYSASFSRSN